MRKTREEGRRQYAEGRRNRLGFLRLAFWLLALALTSCSTLQKMRPGNPNPTPNTPNNSDPLLGIGSPTRPASPSGGTAAPSPTSSLPPIPTPSGTSSPAALASGPPRSLSQDRDLRIGEPRSNSGNGGWAGQGTNSPPSSGAILKRPEPITEPVSRRDPMQQAPNVTPVSGMQAVTYEQLQAQLAVRGVNWQQLETVSDTGEWRFMCTIPNRQNPNLRRTYRATARIDLAAIQAVLEQIEREN